MSDYIDRYAVLSFTPETGDRLHCLTTSRDEAIAIARCQFGTDKGRNSVLVVKVVEAFEPGISTPDPYPSCPLCSDSEQSDGYEDDLDMHDDELSTLI